jgi:hypothetical protein
MANKKYGLFSIENTIDFVGTLMIVASLASLFVDVKFANHNPFIVPPVGIFISGLLLSGFARILKRLAAIESLLKYSSQNKTEEAESKLSKNITSL